jgi:hypothetical protein
VVSSLAKIAAASAVMGLGCAGFLRFIPLHGSFLVRAGLVAAGILGACGVYLAVTWFLRCEELGELRSVLRRADAAA